MKEISREQLEQMLLSRSKLLQESLLEVKGFNSRKQLYKNSSTLNLTEYDLSELDLSGLDLTGTNLSGANLTKANLTKTILDGAILDGAILDRAEMIETSLRNVDLRQVNLRTANSSPYLLGANLVGAQLQGVNWIKCDLSGLNMRLADLQNANLRGSYFSQTNLEKTNLEGAVLAGADLSLTILKGANLRRVDLTYCAKLIGADLFEADLSNANLSEADLSGANLEKAVLTGCILQDVRYNEATKWPDSFDPVAAGAIPMSSSTIADQSEENAAFNHGQRLFVQLDNDANYIILSKSSNANGKVHFVNDNMVLSGEHNIRLFEIDTAKELAIFPSSEGNNKVMTVTFDQSLVASADWDFNIKVWETSTISLVHILKGHTCEIMALTFDPAGKILASIDLDAFLRVWDLNTGKQIQLLRTPSWGGFHLAFASDGKSIGVANAFEVNFWDISNAQKVWSVSGFAKGHSGILFSPDGLKLAVASHGHKLKLREMVTGQDKELQTEANGYIYALVWHPSSKYLALGIRTKQFSQEIRVYKIHPWKLEKTFISPIRLSITSITFNPNGTKLAGSFGEKIVVWTV